LNKKFQFLSHTADVKIQIFGRTREELFKNALEALNSYLGKFIETKDFKEQKFKIVSNSIEILLIDFLNEALFYIQTENKLISKVEFRELTNNKAQGSFFLKKAEIKKDVKAITYHDLALKNDQDENLSIIITLDI
jgi:SHS2 domain-containing protein